MKTCLAIVALLCLLCGCAAECAPVDAAPWYSFTDDLGSTVSLDAPPETVAILFSSYADIWCTAGGRADITVGESVERGFASPEAILVDEGSGHSAIDMEQLIAAAPDLVIGTTDHECQVQAVELCARMGIPAAAFRVENFEDYLHVLEIFTALTGHRESYDIHGTQLKSRIDSLFDTLPEDGQKRVLFIRAGSTASSTKAKTAGENFVCSMLEELGAYNIADSAPVLLDSLSIEAILAAQPDFIFISTMGNTEAAIENVLNMFSQSGWRDLEAVKEENYVFLEKELFHFKPNSRWDEAYEFLIDSLYSEK